MTQAPLHGLATSDPSPQRGRIEKAEACVRALVGMAPDFIGAVVFTRTGYILTKTLPAKVSGVDVSAVYERLEQMRPIVADAPLPSDAADNDDTLYMVVRTGLCVIHVQDIDDTYALMLLVADTALEGFAALWVQRFRQQLKRILLGGR